MKLYLVPIIVLLFSLTGNTQTLKKMPLTKAERKMGIYQKFQQRQQLSYVQISLILYRDSTYVYRLRDCMTTLRSAGKWQQGKGKLILESSLKKESPVPVEVRYGASGKYIDSCDIAIVEDSDAAYLPIAHLLINNDSTECFPSVGKFNGSYSSINRVKVLFENGMVSSWVPVKAGTRKVSLRVLTDVPIREYEVMDKWVYQFKGKLLERQ
ncbi:hypothetical protein CLV59_11313 [Chitinophaga dinghuensis]|uniref:Uncharacterized protein n=1 Tax=Chitinophaga dinghuensis TaxID=1539050 RepID=A0A327VKV3_9BACT|nr:hypothetical protein [Chitinophaga dinghuensis]RAJ73461.1 hypothetical protein CLV59_11313 [Chitinophaga dinghuensis]